MKKLSCIFLCSTLLILTSVTTHANAPTPEREEWVNVFVHGIMSIRPHLTATNLWRFFTDNVDNTIYSESVTLMRQDDFFYKNQAMQGFGLHKIDRTPRPGNAPGGIAHMFDHMTKIVDRDKKIHNHFYTFGWSGLMSRKHRYQDAKKCYIELAQEVARLREQGINPKVRVISYSHGGNVALNLGAVRQKEDVDQSLSVDELVLMGVPIQHETDHYVADKLFKKAYHLYSRGDRIQKIDFFSFNRFFSRRIFTSRKSFQLPEKLLQVQVKITRDTEPEVRRRKKRGRHYPHHNLKSVRTVAGKANVQRDASPGHIELWFFGWTPQHYREDYPLYPLPIVTVLPAILQSIRDFDEKHMHEIPTIVDIRPEHNLMVVKNQKSDRSMLIADFFTTKELNKLKEDALIFKPADYTDELYQEHIQVAHDKARDFFRSERKKRKRLRRARRRQRKKSRRLAKNNVDETQAIAKF